MSRYMLGLTVRAGSRESIVDAIREAYAWLPIGSIIIDQPSSTDNLAEVAAVVNTYVRIGTAPVAYIDTLRAIKCMPILRYGEPTPNALAQAAAGLTADCLIIESRVLPTSSFTQDLTNLGITPKQLRFSINTIDIHTAGINIRDPHAATIFLATLNPEWIGLIVLAGVSTSPGTYTLPFADDDAIWGPQNTRSTPTQSSAQHITQQLRRSGTRAKLGFWEQKMNYEHSGCHAIVSWARQHDIPVVLDTHREHSDDDIEAMVIQCGWQ